MSDGKAEPLELHAVAVFLHDDAAPRHALRFGDRLFRERPVVGNSPNRADRVRFRDRLAEHRVEVYDIAAIVR